MRRYVSTLAIAAVTAIAVGGVTVASRSDPRPASRTAHALAAETPAPGPLLALVPATIGSELEKFDVSITPVASTTLMDQIPLERAVASARQGFGFGDQGVAQTATLASVTLGQYGRELEPDPRKPSRIDPIIKDRVAWVLTFTGVHVPRFGPAGAPEARTDTQTVVAFVDPTTGEYLAGLSF